MYQINSKGTPPTDIPDLVSYTHPDYCSNQDDIQLLEDVWHSLSGCKEQYLPQQDLESGNCYNSRCQSTAFINHFKRSITSFAALLTNFELSEDAPQSIVAN